MTAILLDHIRENGHNVRGTPATADQDAKLEQSIRALGVLQPVLLRIDAEADGYLIVAGHRRVRCARAAGLTEIPAEVLPALSPGAYAAIQTAENVVRVPMDPVDQWRAMVTLQDAGYSLAQAAAALGLSERRSRQLDKLGRIAPPVLEIMIGQPLPNDETLSAIASAPIKQQQLALKQTNASWPAIMRLRTIANHCTATRIPRNFAIFDVTTSKIRFEEDLFAEPGSSEQFFTSDVARFIAAQKDALAKQVEARSKKERVQIVESKGGSVSLPKGFDRLYGTIKKRYPAKGTEVLFVSVQDSGYGIGKVIEVAATDRAAVKAAAARKTKEIARAAATAATDGDEDDGDPDPIGGAAQEEPAETSALTRKGQSLLAALKNSALQDSLDDTTADVLAPLPLHTLCAALIVALSSDNVSIISSPNKYGARTDFKDLAEFIINPSGTFVDLNEQALTRHTAKALSRILRITDPVTGAGSGKPAEWIGAAIGADVALPRFDTEEFLSCMSKAALTAVAAENGRTGLKTASGLREALQGALPDWRPTSFGAPGPIKAPDQPMIEDDQEEAA